MLDSRRGSEASISGTTSPGPAFRPKAAMHRLWIRASMISGIGHKRTF